MIEHRHAVDFPGVEGRDDARVVELADRLHFALESGDGLGVVHPLFGDHLQGDDAVELGVQGLVDRAHAALAEFLQKAILAERTQGERFGRGVGLGQVLRPGQRGVALGLGGERVVGRRRAELADQRVVRAVERGEHGLALGVAFDEGGHPLGVGVRELSDGIGQKLFASRASGGGHGTDSWLGGE